MSFVEELKRRRVIRVALLYVAAAFATIQVAEVLQPALLLPEWTVRLVLALLLLGAPITLILAWFFDVGPSGVSGDVIDTETPNSAVTPATLVGAALLVGVGLLAGLAVGGGGSEGDSDDISISDAIVSTPALASIAVLPLEDLSPDGDQGAFVDGISEEIRNALNRVTEISVASRNSSFAYRGRNVDSREVGAALDVGTLLEGSLRKDGSTIRVTVELVNAEDGTQIWSSSYTEELDNIFELQEDIARTIVGELQVPMQLDVTPFLVPQRTERVDAYETYLYARELFRLRNDSLRKAVPLLRQVVAQDSLFAPAWALLAEALPIWNNGAPSDSIAVAVERIREARAAADRAVALDSTFAEAWAALGTVSRERLDWDGAVRYLRKAVELDPNYAEAHSNLGEALSAIGRLEEARPHHERAIELDPNHFIYRMNYTWLAYSPRFNEATLPHARWTVENARGSGLVGAYAFNLAVLGRFEEAHAAIANSDLPSPQKAALTTILSDIEAGRQTDEGRVAFGAFEDMGQYFMNMPSMWIVYGDLEVAARFALDMGWNAPYMWAGYLASTEELRGYPDYEEARRRRNLPN